MPIWGVPAAHAIGGILYGVASDAIKKRGEAAIEKVFRQIEIQEEHRAAMWNFISNQLEDRTASEKLLERHKRALANRRTNPREEDKLSEFLTRIFVSVTDHSSRQVAFRALGRADDASFAQAQAFVEANKLLTWGLLARKYGRDLWGWIRDSGVSPTMAHRLEDIQKWMESDFPAHRRYAQQQMDRRSRDVIAANRRSRAAHRVHWYNWPSLQGAFLAILAAGVLAFIAFLV